MFRDIRAAIIDLDGTMLDTIADIHWAVNQMRADFDLPPLDLQTVRNLVGKGTEYLISGCLGSDPGDDRAEIPLADALSSYLQHYRNVNGRFAALFPGVLEGLEAFKTRGIRLACVTNKPIALTVPLLRKTGLSSYFELVYGGDSLPRKKPDPMPLQAVCSEFALLPSQVLAIGDSVNDASAARAAGCRVLNVPYGYNHGQPIQDVDSDGIVSTLLDAANLVSP